MMRRFVVYSLSLTLLFPTVQLVVGQTGPAQSAAEEAVRRQELTILLRKTLKDAQSDQSKGDWGSAAKLYEEAWSLVQRIGDAGIEKEKKETIAGFTSVYLALAKKSYSRAQYEQAKSQVTRVLRVDPKNEEGLKMMAAVDKKLKELEGRLPSRDAQSYLPEAEKARIDSATLTQDGKLLYEMGKLDEAEARLKEAAKLNPDNAGAFYYLRLVEEARYEQEARKREVSIKNKIVEVEKAWNPPVKWGNVTNAANPFARTNIVYTGPGRREIFDKLDKIRFDKFPRLGDFSTGIPLSQVIKFLDEEVRDAEIRQGGAGRGINFIIANYLDIQTQQPGMGMAMGQAVDPTTGQPISSAPQQEQFDVGDVTITLDPPLRNVRLADVLDAIIKVANKQIKYSVEEYGIYFTRRIPEEPQLFTRTFRLNPNTFFQGLEGVIGYQFVGSSLGGGGYGGAGGYGGGMMGGMGGYGGGGYGGGGYGGGGYGGGYGGYGGGGPGYMLPTVDVTGMGGYGGGYGGYGGGMGGYGGGGYGGGGYGGGGYGGGYGSSGYGSAGPYNSSGGGIWGVTRMSDMSMINQMVRAYFSAAGVDLGGTNVLAGGGIGAGQYGQFAGGFQNAQGKAVFYNDRTGILLVRATLQELDIIEAALQVLNITPDQVTIEVKFVDIGQEDAKALGFDWYLGQMMMNGGAIGAGAGTYPSVAGRESLANPYGVFPGVFGQPSAQPSPGTDQLLTGGLRNTTAEGTPIPAVGTITGILTDPQFRVVIRALEQRKGVDILAAPKVTTVSGRQAQIQAVDIQQVVTSLSVGGIAGGTTLGTTTGGGVGTTPVTTGGTVGGTVGVGGF